MQTHSFAYDLQKVIPEHIRVDHPELVEFLDKYYHWLNQEGNPARILNNLPEYRDIDQTIDTFLDHLHREIAISIPRKIMANKRKLYKNLIDIYLSRGSVPSYIALFKLVFDDQAELSFPREEILKPSDGKWNAGTQRWIGEDGLLSSNRYIQDSYYYQSFSYVIKTGQTVNYWRDIVKRVLHPAGFAFFGTVTIFTEAVLEYSPQKTSAKMPLIQPGRAEGPALPYPVITGPVRVPCSVPFNAIIITIATHDPVQVTLSLPHLDEYKFLSPDEVDQYKMWTVQDVLDRRKINTSISTAIGPINIVDASELGISADSSIYTADSSFLGYGTGTINPTNTVLFSSGTRTMDDISYTMDQDSLGS